MIKVSMVSLGCPKNLVDSEYMTGALAEAGFQFSEVENADVVIVNTCTFIEDASAEAFEVLESIIDGKVKGKPRVIAAGCLAQRMGKQLLEELPELDGIIGVADVCSIVKKVEEVFKGVKGDVRKPGMYYDAKVPRALTTGNYAWLTVAGGCDNHCAYCIIPSVRGDFKSRRMDSVIREAENLASIGALELILIAQDTFRYGLDLYGKFRLNELLTELNKIDGIRWIRVMYGHPSHVDEDILKTMASLDKVVPYLDLPLQHSETAILKRMGRPYTREDSLKLINTAREIMPDITIRSTFITGLPGEGEEEFQGLMSFIKEARLDRVGFFPYSPQEGTRAAEMDDVVSEDEAISRAQQAAELQEEISSEILSSRIGKVIEVLVEGEVDCDLSEFEFPGLTETDLEGIRYGGRDQGSAPDIDGLVYIKGPARPGTFVKATVTATGVHDMVASVLGEAR